MMKIPLELLEFDWKNIAEFNQEKKLGFVGNMSIVMSFIGSSGRHMSCYRDISFLQPGHCVSRCRDVDSFSWRCRLCFIQNARHTSQISTLTCIFTTPSLSSLVMSLTRSFQDTDQVQTMFELRNQKAFGHHIDWIIFCVKLINLNIFLSNHLLNKVISNIHVLCSFMMHLILSEMHFYYRNIQHSHCVY